MTLIDPAQLSRPPAAPNTARRISSLRWPLAIARRGLIVLGLVVVVTFLLVRILPGNPVDALAGPRASRQTRDTIREQLGLNGSLAHQFGQYLGRLLRGDLGVSTNSRGGSVASTIGHSLPVTLTLVLGAIVVALVVGIPIGLFAAHSQGTADLATRSFLTVLLTFPPFFLGLLLIWGFSLTAPLLPAGGWGGWAQAPRFMVLPVVSLSVSLIPLVARATRQAAKEALGEMWVEAAEVRGLSRTRLALRHILPNSVLPVVTLIGYNAGVLISGAVIVEAVFSLPGIGQQLVNAVSQRDYPTIQGVALVSAVAVVVFNAVTDLAYGWIDPRVRRT